MKTTAYISSNPEQDAQIDAAIEMRRKWIRANEEKCKALSARSAEYRRLKKDSAAQEEAIKGLQAARPVKLFSEANAVADLEQEMAAEVEAWETAKTRWLADAAENPAYAVQHAAAIVGQQAIIEDVIRLNRHWQKLAESDGRSLATFRKAYDEAIETRRREMMSKLTSCNSTCAFHNAVEHEQGRALALLIEYRDRIQYYLASYEEDAGLMTHVA